jgi:hypothetical protein
VQRGPHEDQREQRQPDQREVKPRIGLHGKGSPGQTDQAPAGRTRVFDRGLAQGLSTPVFFMGLSKPFRRGSPFPDARLRSRTWTYRAEWGGVMAGEASGRRRQGPGLHR